MLGPVPYARMAGECQECEESFPAHVREDGWLLGSGFHIAGKWCWWWWPSIPMKKATSIRTSPKKPWRLAPTGKSSGGKHLKFLLEVHPGDIKIIPKVLGLHLTAFTLKGFCAQRGKRGDTLPTHSPCEFPS